jgi:hypothetical protein
MHRKVSILGKDEKNIRQIEIYGKNLADGNARRHVAWVATATGASRAKRIEFNFFLRAHEETNFPPGEFPA